MRQVDYSVVYSVLYNFRRKPRYIQHNPRRRHRHSICARARVGQIYRRNVGLGGSQGPAHRYKISRFYAAASGGRGNRHGGNMRPHSACRIGIGHYNGCAVRYADIRTCGPDSDEIGALRSRRNRKKAQKPKTRRQHSGKSIDLVRRRFWRLKTQPLRLNAPAATVR